MIYYVIKCRGKELFLVKIDDDISLNTETLIDYSTIFLATDYNDSIKGTVSKDDVIRYLKPVVGTKSKLVNRQLVTVMRDHLLRKSDALYKVAESYRGEFSQRGVETYDKACSRLNDNFENIRSVGEAIRCFEEWGYL